MKYFQYILIIGLWFTQVMAYAGEETYRASLKGNEILSNGQLMTSDAWHAYMANPINVNKWADRGVETAKNIPFDRSLRFTNTQVDGYVSLRWEGSAEEVFQDNWNYKIEVEINSWDTKGNPMPVITRWLYIDHKIARNQEFKDWDVLHIPGANRVLVKVLNAEYTLGSNTSSTANGQSPLLMEDLYIEAEVQVKRNFNIDVTIGDDIGAIKQIDFNQQNRTVSYAWKHIEGAEEYELEWLYLSTDLDVIPSFASVPTLDWDRATRVSLKKTNYKLELPYDRGRVYFRVRGVGYGNELEHHLVTKWRYPIEAELFVTVDFSSSLPQVNFTPLEKDKNWTYSATYAEEGKRVEVLNFADGTGRARQSVTKDNSYENSIVSETVFDREGRQAIQVIPSVAPKQDNQLKFFEHYNLAEVGGNPADTKPIHWTHFDEDDHYGTTTLPADPIELSPTSGSSQYFSGNNPLAYNHNNQGAFLPDAKKYPYTQTIYDNQGRVKTQTGLGEHHNLGSGHETKYYYATAFQQDLDELFGSEVGYAEHYSMMMTKDPNGQLSIAYTNLAGKTVATALIGNPPLDTDGNALVDALGDDVYRYPTTRQKTASFTPFNRPNRVEDADAKVIYQEFMVTSIGSYDFEYKIDPTPFFHCGTVQTPCEYELQINLYDSESNIVNSKVTNIASPQGINPFNGFVDLQPGTSTIVTFTFDATQVEDIQSYTIEKVLRLKSIDDRVAQFEDQLNSVKDYYLEDLVEYYNDPVNNPEPAFSHPCIDRAITPKALTSCGDTVSYESQTCAGLKSILRSDLLPGGQYFENTDWLTQHIFSFSNNSTVSYQGVQYASWEAIKQLSFEDIKGLMTDNGWFERHPEWCVYEYMCETCVDVNGKSWYDALLEQDGEWNLLDFDDPDDKLIIQQHLTLPNGFTNICTNDGNNGSYYGIEQYGMIGSIGSIIDGYTGPNACSLFVLDINGNTDLENKIKAAVCSLARDDNGIYYDLDDLTKLSGTLPPDVNNVDGVNEQLALWSTIKAMMLECKKRGIADHINGLHFNSSDPDATCTGYLKDDDKTDNLLTNKGFYIRIPYHYDILDLTETVYDVNTNPNSSSTMTPLPFDPVATANSFVNNQPNVIGHNTQRICNGNGKIRIDGETWKCKVFGRTGLKMEYYLDFSDVDPSNIPNGVPSSKQLKFMTLSSSHGTFSGTVYLPCDKNSLQQEIDVSLIQSLPNNISADIEVKASYVSHETYKVVVTLPNIPKYNKIKMVEKRSGGLQLGSGIVWIRHADRFSAPQYFGADCAERGDFNVLCDFYKIVDAIPYNTNITAPTSLGINYGANYYSLGDIPASLLNGTYQNSHIYIQSILNDAVSALPNAQLRDDIRLFAYPRLDGVEIVLKLKGWTIDFNGYQQKPGLYAGTQLVVNGVAKNIKYFACDKQNLSTCICQEIDAIKNEYTTIPPGYNDIYDVIVKRYNDLPYNWTVSRDDILYIENNYCSANPSNSTIPAYPIGSYQDLAAWKVAFKQDTYLETNAPGFKNEIAKCLDIQTLSCEEEAIALAVYNANVHIDGIIEQLVQEYEIKFKRHCIEQVTETLDMTYTDRALHYTLYYYDASGNLEKTVPPTGVELFTDPSDLLASSDERNQHKLVGHNPSPKEPSHAMPTTYKYNTLNEVVTTSSPDRGTTNTYYDILGRPVFSQNAKQVAEHTANYINYDPLGRIIETGVIKENATPGAGYIPITFSTLFDPNNVALRGLLDDQTSANILNVFSGWTKSEIRKTIYSKGLAYLESRFEEEVGLRRNRVGAQTYSMDGQTIDCAMAYNYDVFGNAKEIWQYYPQLAGNQYKQLKYDYDLISGVVHQVDYQKGRKDQLSFKYAYDANNRLIKASSSINGFIWNTEAKYTYYLHGPLQRVELGEDKVQGSDYVYNIHGWIKGVNTNTLEVDKDPGRDGSQNALWTPQDIHKRVAPDIFGYAVHYYDGDYQAINNSASLGVSPSGNLIGNLYNGNIGSVIQAQTRPNQGQGQQALPIIWKKYRYDQLHRIVGAQSIEKSKTDLLTQGWTGSFGNALQTSYSYDPNGNILAMNRFSGNNLTNPSLQVSQIDNLTYEYDNGQGGLTSDPKLFVNNKLDNVKDALVTNLRDDDIESQNNNNYIYDEIGSLHADASEAIEEVEWTSEQKVHYVKRTATNPNNLPDLKYVYDFQGNRISKIEIPNVAGQDEKHTVYVRDLQGNVLAVYQYNKTPAQQSNSIYTTPNVYLKEQMIYGSDRLGIIKRNVQTGGPVKVLGDGNTLGMPITQKVAVNSYLGHIESDQSLSYRSFNLQGDEQTVDNTYELRGVESLALDRLDLKSFDVLGANDAVVQRLERIRGNYRYELKNFRGDVRQIITDVKYREEINHEIAYSANVIQSTDNYPFGWEIAERSFSVDQHRFGFNGMEKNPEINNGNLDFGARIYDGRIGRWWSVDPDAIKFPEMSSYTGIGNNPIIHIDPDGETIILHYKDKSGKNHYYEYEPGVKPKSDIQFFQDAHEAISYVAMNDKYAIFTDLHEHKKVTYISHIERQDLAPKGANKGVNTASPLEYTQNASGMETIESAIIRWDPKLGLKTYERGEGVAPSTILLHEGAHALRMVNIDNYNKVLKFLEDIENKSYWGDYHNAEEKRVITGPERDYIKSVNEEARRNGEYEKIQGLRESHLGTLYRTDGVNSTTPSDGTEIKRTKKTENSNSKKGKL